MAIKSLYCQPKVCVRVNGKQSKPFDLRQECILSPLRFLIYMNWVDELSQTNECVTIGRCKISFAGFLGICPPTRIKWFCICLWHCWNENQHIQTETLHLSRNPVRSSLQVGGISLKQTEKFRYLRVALTSDGRKDEELDV